jgi:phosphotransferase system IIB component
MRAPAPYYSQLSIKTKQMRVIMEPADTVGQMKLAEALEALGVVSVDNGKVQMTAGDSAGSLGKLCFNFKRIRKKDIYQAFLDIYASGGIEVNNDELISFLARTTNLGSESSIKTLFYRYKRMIHV